MTDKKDHKALKAFGKNLRRFRLAKNLTTREFADMAEIAHSQVWVLESGKGNPSLSTLLAISKVLEVSLDDLIGQ